MYLERKPSRLIREAEVNTKCRIDISLEVSCLLQFLGVVINKLQIRHIELYQLPVRLYAFRCNRFG